MKPWRRLFLPALVSALGLSAPLTAQTVHTVELAGFDFTPADIVIQVGDTVEWVWVEGLHNVVSGSGGIPDGNFTSGQPEVGGFYSLTFDQAFLDAQPIAGDLYPYFCEIHVGFGMIGSVQVEGSCTPFIRGDANDDEVVNVADVIYLLDFLFVGGPPPSPSEEAADVNGDGSVDVADAIALLAFLFSGGPPPLPPFPDPGGCP